MTDREKTVLPELDVTDADCNLAYDRYPWVCCEDYNDQIPVAWGLMCRERQLLAALKRIQELESQLKEKPVS